MKANCAKTPPKGSAGGPVDVEAYLQYAQENIETSRMLLEKGNLRYAVFLANEGLELFVKAHMLRYKIIDRAITAKHFPYPAAVKEMAKITKSNIGKKPPNIKQLEQVLDPLHTLEEVFDRDLAIEYVENKLRRMTFTSRKRQYTTKHGQAFRAGRLGCDSAVSGLTLVTSSAADPEDLQGTFREGRTWPGDAAAFRASRG